MKKIVIFITLMLALLMCIASCALPSSSNSNSNSKHTHEFGEWFITKNATCAEDGVKVRCCSCGEKQSDSIPKLSHTVVIDEAVEPTCTRTGLTEGKHCSECSEIIVAQTVIGVLEHTEVVDAAVAPTCIKAGLTEGKHCSVCNATIIAQTVVDAIGHTEVVDNAIASTCTSTGLTGGKHCSVCDEVLVAQIETAKINHSYDDKYDEECNKCGFIRDAECAHTNVSTQPAKSATCTAPGLTEGKVCIDCEEVILTQTVIDAKGHTEVIDAAVAPTYENTGLSEGKHCSACGTVLIEQQTIPMLQPKYHTIWYENIKTADYPTENNFAEHLGLNPLPKISVDGYEFIGWYTEPNGGGEFMNKIPKGYSEDITLYAYFTLLTYDITYKNAPNNSNPISYDIEDKLKLETPEWSGLVFTHWSDEEGNKYFPDANITFLPEKMTGDLILTANWKVRRNIATPAEGGAQLYEAYSGEDGFLYFFYDLGTIEHVVLDNLNNVNVDDLYYKSEGMPLNLTLSKTVTISEETAKTIASTVSRSISSTNTMEDVKNWAKTNTNSWSHQTGGSVEGGFGGENVLSNLLGLSIKAKIEDHHNWGGEDSETNGWTHSNATSTTGGTINEDTITSHISYRNEITNEIEENYPISADLPSGYYARVHAGNIRVIAVISYDISTGALYLNTYTRLDNMHSMIMYYADVNQLNNPSVESLDFIITEAHKIEIENKIKNSYYVKYDANGGTGVMPTTLHTVGVKENLSKNTFTKAGYTFKEWKFEIDNNAQTLQDGQVITNLTDAFETVTLKAVWEPIEYTIVYDANSGVGTMPNSTHTYDVTANLAKNTYTKYGYTFYGWEIKIGDSVQTMKDGGDITNLVSTSQTITAKAKWKPYEYTIRFDYNNPSKYNGVSVNNNHDQYQIVTFGESYTLPTPLCKYFRFIGWQINGKTYLEGTWDVVLSDNDVMAVAIWEKECNDIEVTFDSGRTPNLEINDDSSDQNLTYVQLNIPKEMLLAYGYKELRLYIEIYLEEVQEGKQNINIKSYSKETLKSIEFIYTPGECTKTEGMVNGYSSIDLAYVDENCGFWVSYFGSGGGLFDDDAWLLKHTFIVATPQ